MKLLIGNHKYVFLGIACLLSSSCNPGGGGGGGGETEIDFSFDDECITVQTELSEYQINESCSGTSDYAVFNNNCMVELQPRPDLTVNHVYLPIDMKYTEECALGDYYFMLYLHDQWGWFYSAYQVDLIPGKGIVGVGDVEILPQWTVGARQLIKLVAVPLGFSEELPSGVKTLHPHMFTIASFELVKTEHASPI